MDKELDQILQKRHVPEAPAYLANRIIDAAVQHKPKMHFKFIDLQSMILDLLLVPRPVLALCLLLLAGLTLGLSFGINDVQLGDLSSLIVVEDEFYAGGFL